MSRKLMTAALLGAVAMTAAPALSQPYGGGGGGWGGDRRDGPFDRVPDGDWQTTCRDITVQRGELSARCLDRRGGLQFSTIRYRECRRDIVNWDGRLTCGRPGPGGPGGWGDGPGGPGGGRARAVLYEHVGYQGRSLEVSDDMPNLVALGFNDIASSMRVSGGTWEVCEHVNYQGRCNLISSDIDNFVPLRMNDTISSVRRKR